MSLLKLSPEVGTKKLAKIDGGEEDEGGDKKEGCIRGRESVVN